ncbi:MAG: aminoacyl-tRNA deacylase [Actinomycetales bacterium]|nr:aminoacyl-tRNA deacylase [Actinomycetales bacterium]
MTSELILTPRVDLWVAKSFAAAVRPGRSGHLGGSGPPQEGGRTAYPGRVSETETRALAALDALGVAYAVTRHGRVGSLAEAAALRGVEPGDIVKTLVVRRAEDDYLFVLVPGDREFSWPKLRALLGTSRLSMPDAAGAYAVTGYERGTITPFGAQVAWPVVVDASLAAVPGRRVSMGSGAQGVAVTLSAQEMIAALGAQVADVADSPG